MKDREAIVLAGGLGTRLREVLPDMPKCMAPVRGLPFLTYVLDYLGEQGINKVILSVGYRKEQIISYFGDIYHNLEIEYAVENEPLGTGGAVKLASSFCKQDKVFVVNGDTYFIPELAEMGRLHQETAADISIAVKYLPETSRYGLILAEADNRINDFREKDPASLSGWINGGIYLLNRKIFDAVPETKFSLENELFRTSCSKLRLIAFRTDAFFLDMGIPDDYARAQTLIGAPQTI
ncbi:MAG: nucleotidyltransferase family protein [Bacteroidota bacterium]